MNKRKSTGGKEAHTPWKDPALLLKGKQQMGSNHYERLITSPMLILTPLKPLTI